jgi:hypothetical protein
MPIKREKVRSGIFAREIISCSCENSTPKELVQAMNRKI